MGRPPQNGIRQRMIRREFLSSVALAPLWRPAALLASTFEQVGDPQIKVFGFSALQTLLTPNEGFYIRNHFAVPRLSPPEWKLHVDGRVRSPFEISYADILRQPSRTLTVTLECAGNGVGSAGVSTATWTGISLASLLKMAGLTAGVRHVRLVGADRGTEGSPNIPLAFARSIPLEKALHPDTLLAFQMNGAPLPAAHGYPVRAIVPGWYGMDSVKWLVRIEALDHEDASFFMTQRYVSMRLQVVGSEQSPVTRMRVKSLITQPRGGDILVPRLYTIRGVAWAGENKVAQVEVSTDGGENWVAATLDQDVRPYTWVLWSYPWEVRAPGVYEIVARATDDQGNVQAGCPDALRVDSYEMNWYHSVRCEVR